MSTKINQKEYLKKYLSDVGDEKKKKKKKKRERQIAGQTVTIIDDDIDLSKLQNIDDDNIDLFATGEDAPQIVGVIDDRPPELQALDYKNSNKWRVVSNDDGFNSNLVVQQISKDGIVETISKKTKNIDDSPQRSKNKKHKPRRSPSSDISPIRKKHFSPRVSPKRSRNKSPDLSPERNRHRSSRRYKKRYSPNFSPRKTCRSPDKSPSRKRINEKSPDLSPIRKHGRRSELSSQKKKTFEQDLSPTRRKNRSIDQSPVSRNRCSSSDYSPKLYIPITPDTSPRQKSSNSPEKSLGRRPKGSPDLSPVRKRTNSHLPQKSRKSRWNENPESPKEFKKKQDREKSLSPSNSPGPSKSKLTKTLDGKNAGLQSAAEMRVEIAKFKEKEKRRFDAMSEDMSGKNAEVVVRDRKTGKRRDLEKEAEEQNKKAEKDKAKKAIYDRWGAGLKQVEDYKNHLEEVHHEMNKPLARYSDDQDLDEHLKKQERDGDPMLEYMRQKEREQRKKRGEPELPKYQGSFPDNRFNIRPGYRWDGVDRSNGFEKKWFEVISKKKATEEEAYRYSTEDM